MDITNALRFVDDEGLAVLAEAEDLLAGPLAPPYRAAVAQAAHVIKGLQRLVRELLDRLEMADAYVASATVARQDLADIPDLGDAPPRGEPDDQCRNCGSWGWKIDVYTSPVNGCCYDCNRRFHTSKEPK